MLVGLHPVVGPQVLGAGWHGAVMDGTCLCMHRTGGDLCAPSPTLPANQLGMQSSLGPEGVQLSAAAGGGCAFWKGFLFLRGLLLTLKTVL